MVDELEQCPNISFQRELICEEDDLLLSKKNIYIFCNKMGVAHQK